MHSPVPPQSLHSTSMALTTPGYRSECHHRPAAVRQRGGDLTALLAEISVLGAPQFAVYTKPPFKGRSSLAFGPDRFPAPVRTVHPAPLVITQKLRKNRLGQQKPRHECLCHTANTGLAGRWHRRSYLCSGSPNRGARPQRGPPSARPSHPHCGRLLDRHRQIPTRYHLGRMVQKLKCGRCNMLRADPGFRFQTHSTPLA